MFYESFVNILWAFYEYLVGGLLVGGSLVGGSLVGGSLVGGIIICQMVTGGIELRAGKSRVNASLIEYLSN